MAQRKRLLFLANAGVLAAALALAACAAPRPIIETDQSGRPIGAEAAEEDIEACISEARGYRDFGDRLLTIGTGIVAGLGAGFYAGATASGPADEIGTRAAGGAIVGSVLGLGIGFYMVFAEDARFEREVESCLEERGYRTNGWHPGERPRMER